MAVAKELTEARISRLAPQTAAELDAEHRVPTLPLAVQLCLRVCIESCAKNVTVSGDLARALVEIADDGQGIPPTLLLSLHAPGTQLQKSLAAVSHTCWMEVTSKSRQSFETCFCSYNRGQLLRQGLAAQQRSKSGTNIIIR